MGILLLCGLCCFSGCGGLGTKLEAPHVELYYTSRITPAEAQSLLDYFTELPHEEPWKVQIDKRDDTYVVRVCVRENAWKEERVINGVKVLGRALSENVLHRAKVEMQICDQNFHPQRILR